MKLYFMQDGTRMYVKDHSQHVKEGSSAKPKAQSHGSEFASVRGTNSGMRFATLAELGTGEGGQSVRSI